MNTVADLKAALDYAKSKVNLYDKRLSEAWTNFDEAERDMWVTKVEELERQLEQSVRILEG